MLLQKWSSVFQHFSQSRNIYHFLNFIFNRVNEDRVKLVGSDRACAEWLMRNGAFIRWVGEADFVGHYNSLPLNEPPEAKYYIEEVKAVEASIDHHGFPHFRGCKFVKTMNISSCWYITDKCVEYLSYLDESLISLQLFKCAEITDDGVRALVSLRKLQNLYIGHLEGVKNLDECLAFINTELPNCRIEKINKEESNLSKK